MIVGQTPAERMTELMKKWMALLLTLILTLSCTVSLADTQITVTGNGEVRVSADTAVISLGVNARDKDVLKAQQKVNETISAIRKALIAQGVKEENINTEYINIYAMYDYQNDQEQLSAYNASSTLAIRVTDLDSVGALIDVSFAAGANTLNGISFSASDTEEAKAEAMEKAVEDARKKADILAAASGLQITGVEALSDGGVCSYENNIGNVYAKGADFDVAEEKAADTGTVIQAARLVVSASVNITFEAKKAAKKQTEEGKDESVTEAPAPRDADWVLPETTDLTPEASACFNKAMASLMGVSYEPLGLLAEKDGLYCILCRATVIYPDAKPYYVLVYVSDAGVQNIWDLWLDAHAVRE